MRLTKRQALLVGTLTLVPYAWLGLYLGYLSPRLFREASDGLGEAYFNLFNVVFWLGAAAFVLTVAVWGFYLFFVWRSDRIPRAQRRTWHLALLIGNLAVMPFFWYLFMWREPRSPHAHQA
jgi:hypothetical protein